MQQERRESHIPARPEITYRGFDLGYPTNMPFKFIIDAENLGKFMRDTMRYGEDLITDTLINVSTNYVRTGDIRIGAGGISFSNGIIRGETEVIRNPQGKAVIRINAGDTVKAFLETKEDLIAYSYLSKRADLPDPLKRDVSQTEEQIKRVSVDPKRMLAYLREAPIDAVDKFLDKLLARKLALEITETLIHEVSHLAEMADGQSLNKKRQRLSSLKNTSVLVSASTGLTGLLESLITGQHDPLLVATAIMTPAIAANFYLRKKLRRNYEEAMSLNRQGEEYARLFGQEQAAANRTSLIILTQNPSYQKG